VITRREFVQGAVASVVAVPLVVEAQQATKSHLIGVLYPGVDNSIFRGNLDGFREALSAAGFVEGRNVTLNVRAGDGATLGSLAAQLMKQRPDVVLAVARPGVAAMRAATSTTPVLAIDLESDPVAAGFVKTLARTEDHVAPIQGLRD